MTKQATLQLESIWKACPGKPTLKTCLRCNRGITIFPIRPTTLLTKISPNIGNEPKAVVKKIIMARMDRNRKSTSKRLQSSIPKRTQLN